MTAPPPRQLHLHVNAWPQGFAPAAWRMPENSPRGFVDIEHYVRIARIAEEGRFDAIFLPDSLAVDGLDAGPVAALDPTLVLTAVACATTRIGLVATASTSYDEPYNIARRFASLDLLSGGRAGWSIAAAPDPRAARSYRLDATADPASHYRRADECAQVVKGLWNGWHDDALVADPRSGRFVDTGKLRPLRHRGEFFSVHGLLNQPRSPQGHPVLMQAGAARDGGALAARHAEAVFSAARSLDQALADAQGLRQRARALGRDPDGLRMLPGLATCIGGTEAEARRRRRELAELVPPPRGRKRLAQRLGVEAGEAPGEADNWEDGGERGGGAHRELVGTPEQIADDIERWFRAGAADGFNLMPDVLPGGLQDFVDGVVPILQQRGLFRGDYEGSTLREHLGLKRPGTAA
ncbi:NtaA/DmoA family FMN-dependent monooxygenase [Burkholderia gladioli]|uniref:NtaA/DmoA family FMN-dependent monooxygenase n=1 Tax=Burkholderia gladioli TaxID=28095 RepID=UPI0016408199|nr:NtaA/DmoA family FMN-dependent monooxygenase [Burkholderia gladioli]